METPEVVASISNLNNDCLWYIFEHLTVREKIGVVRVSRQWQRVVGEMFDCFDALHFVKGDYDEFGLDASLILQPKNDKLFEIYKFNNVVAVSIGNRQTIIHLMTIHIDWLLKSLPQVTSLSLINVFFGDEDFMEQTLEEEISFNFDNKLQKLSFYYKDIGYSKNYLSRLLNKTTELTEVVIMSNGSCPDNLVRELESRLTNLESLKMKYITNNQVSKMLPTMLNLRKLDVRHPPFGDDIADCLTTFAANSNLECLAVEFFHNFYQLRLLKPPKNLFLFPKLKKLDFSCFALFHATFGSLTKMMPFLDCLKFHLFAVECSCPANLGKQYSSQWTTMTICQICSRLFISNLAAFGNLKTLVLGYDYISEVLHVKEDLTVLLERGALPKLQMMRLNEGFMSSRLSKLFCQKALENPKKSFKLAFRVRSMKSSQSSSDSSHEENEGDSDLIEGLRKPRNLSIVLP